MMPSNHTFNRKFIKIFCEGVVFLHFAIFHNPALNVKISFGLVLAKHGSKLHLLSINMEPKCNQAIFRSIFEKEFFQDLKNVTNIFCLKIQRNYIHCPLFCWGHQFLPLRSLNLAINIIFGLVLFLKILMEEYQRTTLLTKNNQKICNRTQFF